MLGLTKQQIALANHDAQAAVRRKSGKEVSDRFVAAVHEHMREHPGKSYTDAWRYCAIVSHEALHNEMCAPTFDLSDKTKIYLRLPKNADETEMAVAWLANGKQHDAAEIVNMLLSLIALRQARSGEDEADAREWAKGRYPELWERLPAPPHALDGSPKK